MTNQTCPARLPVPPVRVAPTPGRSACWADAPWTEALRSLGGWACGHGGHPVAVRWHHGWLGPDSQASGGTGSSLTGARLSTPAPTEPHPRACCGGVRHRGWEWFCSGTGDSVCYGGGGDRGHTSWLDRCRTEGREQDGRSPESWQRPHGALAGRGLQAQPGHLPRLRGVGPGRVQAGAG